MHENRNIQWLIKTESERHLGPYSTEAVLKMIAEGALTGTEKIRRYPDGKWTAISREPDFYDKLLEALEEIPASKTGREKQEEKQNRFEAETVISTLPRETQNEDSEKTQYVHQILQPLKEAESEKSRAETVVSLGQPQTSAGGERELSQERTENPKKKRRKKKKKTQRPLLIGGVAVVFLIIALFWTDSDVSGKPRLLIPRPSSSASLTAEQVKTGIASAVADFAQDTFEGAHTAQGKLVAVIEGAPQNVEARGILCLVYKELWPFVRQDSQDLDAVHMLAKSAKSIDPTGINGAYCEVVKLMTLGKYKEARGAIEYSLNQPAMANAPVLYQLKAELLFEERDTKTALSYAERAKELWPDWIKPHFDSGKYLSRLENHTEAIKAFQRILQKNPKHKMAQIEYGVSLFKAFKQEEQALNLLSQALSTPGKVANLELARAHFFMALIYAGKKMGAKAKEHSEKAFQLNPSDSQIHELLTKLGGSRSRNPKIADNELVFLGDQHQRTGNCLAAQAEYKTAFDLDPKNAVAAMKAAKCLWQLNQTYESVQWLRKAIKSDPKLSSAYVLLADYQSEQFDYVNAIQTLNKASRLFPNNHDILRGYSLVEFRRNNLKDAIAYGLRAHKIFENDLETLILLAKAYSATADFTAAQKYSVRAIELDSTSTEAQVVYARILTQFQGFETGLLYLKELIKKYSYTLDYRMALADLYREQERSDQAQLIYEQIIDAEPKNNKARIGLGMSYQAQGFFDKALKQFLAASVNDPSDAEGLFRAGILYMDISKFADAITQFKRAQVINPLYPRLNYYIGRAYFQANEYEAALKASLEERKINPNLADSYILAAEIYTASKQFQKCTAEYQQAIKLRPQGADLYVKVARCYRQAGNPDIGKSMLNIAANQESGLPEIYKEQGAIYETEGDSQAAVQAYNKYLTLSPNAPDREEIERRISSIGGGK